MSSTRSCTTKGELPIKLPDQEERVRMQTTHEEFMRLALEEAARAGAAGNVAVGAIITRDGTVVGRGHNRAVSTIDPTAHAEIDAIRSAATTLNQPDLSGCALYTTWEPCPMCLAGILVAGINTLVMGTRYSLQRWGTFSVERFLEQVGAADQVRVVNDVLAEEGLAIYWEWGGPPAGSRSNTAPISRKAP
jgi:tRNA(adenine34) deaminase